MNDLTTISTIFLIISLLISGYFAGLVGMPLGPIRIFFMLFFIEILDYYQYQKFNDFISFLID